MHLTIREHVFLFVAVYSGLLGLTLYLWTGPWNPLKPFAATPVSIVGASVGWFQFGQTAEQLSFRYRFQTAFRDVCDVFDMLGRRLVIFIDDLDRCECDHVVEILEAINYLTSSGSCFVILSMDETRVKDELKRRYGNSSRPSSHLLSPDRFLEKIINVTLKVPPPDISEVHKIRSPIESCIGYGLEL